MLYDVIHSSLAAVVPDSPHALGFLYNHGGLNNQKMAIAGLLVSAIERRLSVNLPYIYVKDQRTDEEYLAKFQDVFDLEAISDFGRRHGIAINHLGPSGVRGGWDCFRLFSGVLGNGSDRAVVEAALDAMTGLKPRIASNPILKRLKDFVFGSLKVQMAIQLRIETDWQAHAQNLRAALGDSEDYGIGFVEILSKVRNRFPDLRLAYVTSDEKSMPASKDEIRAFSRSRFGIDLLWKSDFLIEAELEQLNPLDLSMIDYEIARYSPQFVGQTASTFANILCLEKFAGTRRDVTGHFIYNCLGDVVRERKDNGFSSSAQLALLPSRVWGVLAAGADEGFAGGAGA
jgi:hypothetical protein